VAFKSRAKVQSSFVATLKPAKPQATRETHETSALPPPHGMMPLRCLAQCHARLRKHGDMSPAKTTAERQRELRARRKEEQTSEVRGIFSHPEDHPEVKEAEAKINRRRARNAKLAKT
jgi:hypothetical protein